MLRPYLHLLNREADAGQTALQTLRTLPGASWPEYFTTRPGWRTHGVLTAMLSYARELFDRAPRHALAITTYVTTQVNDVEPIPESVVLVPRSEEHTSELQSRLQLVCRLLFD